MSHCVHFYVSGACIYCKQKVKNRKQQTFRCVFCHWVIFRVSKGHWLHEVGGKRECFDDHQKVATPASAFAHQQKKRKQ